ncbi:hypothetical protein [Vulgatibacter sp.]|uniref:hypothetical protein n=1 Tax=Vulgatibacter sp. TaxID=1971226 RepID=UPI003561308E
MENDDLNFTAPELDDREGMRPRATDLLRRVLVSGVGALFMTEEGIRSLVKEMKLPKEVIGAVIAQADRTKSDIARVVGTEVRSFLESTRMREEMVRMLTQIRLEVRAEVGFKTRDEESSVFEPTVKGKVAVKRRQPAAPRAPRKRATPPRRKKKTSE